MYISLLSADELTLGGILISGASVPSGAYAFNNSKTFEESTFGQDSIHQPEADLIRQVATTWSPYGRSIVESHRRLYPDSNAECFEVGGATVVFVSPTSPLTQVLGFGITKPVDESEFNFLQQYFSARNTPLKIRSAPFTHPSAFTVIARKQFIASDFNFLMVRYGFSKPVTPNPDVSVSILREEQHFVEMFCQGHFEGGYSREGAELARTIFNAEGTTAVGAWINGQLVGVSTLMMLNGMATLNAASTLANFRRRGIHQAMIEKRVALALSLNAKLIMTRVSPGSPSQSNFLKNGFGVGYNTMLLEELK